MNCPYCKAQIRDGELYCSNCGKQIDPTFPSGQIEIPGNSGSMPRLLLPGSRLQNGRYLIKQVLGEGGMGAALLAQDMRLNGKLVVIKELLSEQTDPQKRQEEVRNFEREVSMLAHIDHPLVPNVTDHFHEEVRYFMVQEYVEGENLDQRLNRTKCPMEERDALVCASEVLDILEYLAQHTSPIVHRDIKPANIIIGAKDKRAHLVDFGIMRADETKNAQRKQIAALGTPGYAPPELYQGNADPRSDLYALAATLHHVLTNRDPRNFPPFIYPPLRSLNTQISPDTERILSHALIIGVNQRYQSALVMKQDIDALLQRRFGMMDNSSSFTLDSSGPMEAITVPTGNNTIIPTPGSRLQSGRYLVKQILWMGGMSTAVMLAQDMHLDGKLVIIKELLLENTDPQRIQEDVYNFKREVSILAHIDHPLVPHITDYFHEGIGYFMVQEYIESENLEQLLEHTKQPIQEHNALTYASEVLDTLKYLAEQTPPIVHRNIKPANIIIGAKDKRAHLVGFGIACAESKQTTALGTPGYAPPEQYQGKADPRSDLYALAATLHHLLTYWDPREHPPFYYPDARSLNTLLSPDIERILSYALITNVNQRYQSALVMKQDIDALLQQRFGMMDNSSSFTLDSSGPMEAITVPTGNNTVVTPNSSSDSNLPKRNQPARVPLPPTLAAYSYQLAPYQQGSLPLFQRAGEVLAKLFSRRQVKKTEHAFFAIARAQLENNERAFVNKTYAALAGITQTRVVDFTALFFTLGVQDPRMPISFEISLHASENIEVLGDWSKNLSYNLQNKAPQLVTFIFNVVMPGASTLYIDFYHERHWLKTVHLEFEAIEQPVFTTVW